MVTATVCTRVRFGLGDRVSESSADCDVINLVPDLISWTFPSPFSSGMVLEPCVGDDLVVLLAPLDPLFSSFIADAQPVFSYDV